MSRALNIDLTNPAEVASRMPELRRLHDDKLKERQELNQQIELLSRLIGAASPAIRPTTDQSAPLETLGTVTPRRRRAAPAQDRAVRALEAAGGLAMGPTSLLKFMRSQGMEAPADANILGANLWDAWKAGRIMKAPNGVYTPLDGTGRSDWDRPLTDYFYAAELGMPVPDVPGLLSRKPS